MKNVIVVGLDNSFVCKVAKMLASIVKAEYFNVDKEFEKTLVSSIDYPLTVADSILNKKESELITRILKKENVIMSMKGDTFLSNENYKLCSNFLVIAIEEMGLDYVKNKIQNLIISHSNYSIKKNEQMKEEIKKLLKDIKN